MNNKVRVKNAKTVSVEGPFNNLLMRHYLWLQQPTSYYYNSLANGGYSFEWNVYDDYNKYGHREDRGLGQSGTDETHGSYHVLLPDGRVQTVTYYVDPYNGYQVSSTKFFILFD